MKVSRELSALLDAKRESFNERFTQRRRGGGAPVDAPAFLAHLAEVVDPLLVKVVETHPERGPAVLDALYDASLDLFAESLLGPGSKVPVLREVWVELMPQAIPLLARDPVAITGCLCNAMFQVASQVGTQSAVWMARMKAALPKCASIPEAIDAGLVAAWRAGMPQYRDAALAAAERLKPAIATEALGFTATNIPALKSDRWFHPGMNEQSLRSVGMPGGFTGFGGPFPRPPQVQTIGGTIFALTEDRCWRIVADAFGVWFQRVPRNKEKPERMPKGIAVEGGTVSWGKSTCRTPELANASSSACDGTTLAVTIPTSHHVFLFTNGLQS